MGIASMILGIVALVLSLLGGPIAFLGSVCAIIGIILGSISLKQNTEETSKAKAGLIMSIIAFVFGIIITVSCFLYLNAIKTRLDEIDWDELEQKFEENWDELEDSIEDLEYDFGLFELELDDLL